MAKTQKRPVKSGPITRHCLYVTASAVSHPAKHVVAGDRITWVSLAGRVKIRFHPEWTPLKKAHKVDVDMGDPKDTFIRSDAELDCFKYRLDGGKPPKGCIGPAFAEPQIIVDGRGLRGRRPRAKR